MTATLVITLSSLVILGRFLDFVIGPEGDERTRMALVELATSGRRVVLLGPSGEPLLATSAGQLTSSRRIVLLAARVVDNFLAFWFGESLFSRHATFHCFVLSLSITSLIALAVGIWDPAVWDVPSFAAHELVTVQVTCLVAANFLVDFLSLITTRWLLRRMLGGPPELAWLWVLVQIGLTYVFIVTAMNASFSSIAFARGMITGYFFDAKGLTGFVGQVAEAWWVFFTSYTIDMFLTPITEGRLLGLGGTNLIVFSFAACLPGLIYRSYWTSRGCRLAKSVQVRSCPQRIEDACRRSAASLPPAVGHCVRIACASEHPIVRESSKCPWRVPGIRGITLELSASGRASLLLGYSHLSELLFLIFTIS